MKVFILATVRKPELLPYTLLVFKTIRIGFPTAVINVIGNSLPGYAEDKVTESCEATQCVFENQTVTIHHEFIQWLVQNQHEPFWVVDTDLIFFQSVEGWKFDTALAGYRIPEFVDEFTNAVTKPRLHTSLFYIDPVKVREAIAKYVAQFPDTNFNPKVSLFWPLCIPQDGYGVFYDTCSLLYSAIGGTSFSDEQKNAYAHLNFGTISDLVLPRLKNGPQMELVRKQILENPELGRGVWRYQDQYYADRQFVKDSKDVIAKISEEDAVEAHKWCIELCRGNQSAMSFCDGWYQLCHAWDDVVDTMQDGKLSIGADQMIAEIGFRSAMLYNHPWYIANRELLFPIILDITGTWRVSVAWERSPLEHRRLIADVFRTCGNRLYYFVALLCGGEQHAQDMILKIHERDWLGQHDEHGRPT